MVLSAIIVWIVVTIELTLKFNHASGIYDLDSTGQLIPFIIGIVSMGKTLNALWVDMIKKIEIGVNARNMMVIRDLPATQDIPLQDNE
ncbi:MAG: hypothetical protein Q9195_007649 [Heterodermia aff. obscurata]